MPVQLRNMQFVEFLAFSLSFEQEDCLSCAQSTQDGERMAQSPAREEGSRGEANKPGRYSRLHIPLVKTSTGWSEMVTVTLN